VGVDTSLLVKAASQLAAAFKGQRNAKGEPNAKGQRNAKGTRGTDHSSKPDPSY
jgi:hypothetical protein